MDKSPLFPSAPENSSRDSPFDSKSQRETLSVMDRFKLEFLRPATFKPIALPETGSVCAHFNAPELNAKLVIQAAALPPNYHLQELLLAPFADYERKGARIPILNSHSFYTPEGDVAALAFAAFNVATDASAPSSVDRLSIFKHRLVVLKPGYWFSFDTESWGMPLAFVKESALQSELSSHFRIKELSS